MRTQRFFSPELNNISASIHKLIKLSAADKSLVENKKAARALFLNLCDYIEKDDQNGATDVGKAYRLLWALRQNFNHFLVGNETEAERNKIIGYTEKYLKIAAESGDAYAVLYLSDDNTDPVINEGSFSSSPFPSPKQ